VAEVRAKLAPGTPVEVWFQDEMRGHAILILDQAGWHGAKELRIPTNISALPLPPRSPELNSQENIWQFHASELAVKPDIQILRRHRRSLPLCMEHTYRPTVEDHVHRPTRLGQHRLLIVRTGIIAFIATSQRLVVAPL
jgi:hypothetical protein